MRWPLGFLALLWKRWGAVAELSSVKTTPLCSVLSFHLPLRLNHSIVRLEVSSPESANPISSSSLGVGLSSARVPSISSSKLQTPPMGLGFLPPPDVPLVATCSSTFWKSTPCPFAGWPAWADGGGWVISTGRIDSTVPSFQKCAISVSSTKYRYPSQTILAAALVCWAIARLPSELFWEVPCGSLLVCVRVFGLWSLAVSLVFGYWLLAND